MKKLDLEKFQDVELKTPLTFSGGASTRGGTIVVTGLRNPRTRADGTVSYTGADGMETDYTEDSHVSNLDATPAFGNFSSGSVYY